MSGEDKPKCCIILLLDGTWNDGDLSDYDTNIVRIRSLISDTVIRRYLARDRNIEKPAINNAHTGDQDSFCFKGINYSIFYQLGVGTGPGADKYFGGALGSGLAQNIRRAYKHICKYFVPGCEIFIFGFSRGAYTARSLIGYIGSIGLLQAEHCTDELEQRAWNFYRTPPNDRSPGEKIALKPFMHAQDNVRISCLGLFDTVGALGIPGGGFTRRFNRKYYQFHDTEISPIVRVNLHALAIDENRGTFEASVWRLSPFRDSRSITEQVWFPGVHSDVGGGYINRATKEVIGLDDVALDWMIKRVKSHFSDFPIDDEAWTAVPSFGDDDDRYPTHHESRVKFYKIGLVALRSIANRNQVVPGCWKLVGHSRHNYATVGESIHISAIERLAREVPYDKETLAEVLLRKLVRIGHRLSLLVLCGEFHQAQFSIKNRKSYYLPPNLIDALPNLYAKYVHNTPAVDDAHLTITTWKGEIGNENCKPPVKAEISRAIKNASARLYKLGIDIGSPNLNPHEVWKKLEKEGVLDPYSKLILLIICFILLSITYFILQSRR